MVKKQNNNMNKNIQMELEDYSTPLNVKEYHYEDDNEILIDYEIEEYFNEIERISKIKTIQHILYNWMSLDLFKSKPISIKQRYDQKQKLEIEFRFNKVIYFEGKYYDLVTHLHYNNFVPFGGGYWANGTKIRQHDLFIRKHELCGDIENYLHYLYTRFLYQQQQI
ncbi:hypothetical protein ABK040_004551 [Willaertia magna]